MSIITAVNQPITKFLTKSYGTERIQLSLLHRSVRPASLVSGGVVNLIYAWNFQ
jgi:hypothetical protein